MIVALDAAIAGNAEGMRLLDDVLRNLDAGAAAIEGPAMIGADDVAVLDRAERKLGRAVQAAVLHGAREPFRILPERDRLAEKLHADGLFAQRRHGITQYQNFRRSGSWVTRIARLSTQLRRLISKSGASRAGSHRPANGGRRPWLKRGQSSAEWSAGK